MVHPFVSTRPIRAGRLRALPMSIAAHAIVILVLVAPRTKTSSSAGDVLRGKRSNERVQFVKVAPAPAAAPVAQSSHHAAAVPPKLVQTAAAVMPRVTPISIDLSTVADAGPPLPNVDLTSKVSDSLDFKSPPKADVGGDGLGRGSEGGISNSGIYTADLVERTVMPFPDNPRPVYPPSMLSAGIETAFVVQFVVDTTGRVDDHSLKFPSSAGRLFVDAVQRVLLRSRYRPAELGGHRVAQLVEQQFTFRIAR